MPDPLDQHRRLLATNVKGCALPPPSQALFDQMAEAITDANATRRHEKGVPLEPVEIAQICYWEVAVKAGAKPDEVPAPPPPTPKATRRPDGT